MNQEKAYESYDTCVRCTKYNTMSCLTCAKLNTFSDAVKFITDDFYKTYRENNKIEDNQREDRYEFETVFEAKVEEPVQEDLYEGQTIIDVEAIEVE